MRSLRRWILPALTIITSLLGAWIASSIMAYLKMPTGLVMLAAAVLLPILPIWWAINAEQKMGRRFGWRYRLPFIAGRISQRVLLINLLFIAALLVANQSELTFTALKQNGDWMLGKARGETVESIRGTLDNIAVGLESLHADARGGTEKYVAKLPVNHGIYGCSEQNESQKSGQNLQSSKMLRRFVKEVVDRTNQFRHQNGLSDLIPNPKLMAAAQAHSQNMASQDFYSHTGKDGSHPADRATAACYNWASMAENIAAGYQTPAEVVQGWIDSPGHRANMLNATLTEIGVGYSFLENDPGKETYYSYWTQLFGKPCAPFVYCPMK